MSPASPAWPDGKASLYPPVLSEGAASLLPDGDRRAVVLTVRVDPGGAVQLDTVERAVIRSRAKLAYETVRDTVIVARYGGEEFVVVMPHTDLAGAGVFAERVRMKVQQSLELTISGGTATAQEGDDPNSLLTRADTALYGAKAAGRNRIYVHNGQDIEPVTEEAAAVVT